MTQYYVLGIALKSGHTFNLAVSPEGKARLTNTYNNIVNGCGDQAGSDPVIGVNCYDTSLGAWDSHVLIDVREIAVIQATIEVSDV